MWEFLLLKNVISKYLSYKNTCTKHTDVNSWVIFESKIIDNLSITNRGMVKQNMGNTGGIQ